MFALVTGFAMHSVRRGPATRSIGTATALARNSYHKRASIMRPANPTAPGWLIGRLGPSVLYDVPVRTILSKAVASGTSVRSAAVTGDPWCDDVAGTRPRLLGIEV